MAGPVSIIVPTRNRSDLAFDKAKWALAQKACAEAIFVVDASEDDTLPRLRALAETDARLKVVHLAKRAGLTGARTAGVRAATSEWLVLMDDDDVPSEGFVDALLETADAAEASIVGAPWFNLLGIDDVEGFLAAAPRGPGGPELDRPGIFPDGPWAPCLWICANCLVRRVVFDEVVYGDNTKGNYYREETDFFVSAARAGHRVVVTANAYTYRQFQATGGVDRGSRLKYEYWVLRNNWAFLRRHGAWLHKQGLLRSPAREQASLFARRAEPYARAAQRKLTGGRRA